MKKIVIPSINHLMSHLLTTYTADDPDVEGEKIMNTIVCINTALAIFYNGRKITLA